MHIRPTMKRLMNRTRYSSKNFWNICSALLPFTWTARHSIIAVVMFHRRMRRNNQPEAEDRDSEDQEKDECMSRVREKTESC